MRTSYTLAMSLPLAVFFAACSTTPTTPIAPATASNPAPITAKQADTRTVQTINAGTVDPLNDAKGALAQRSIYFDFDAYVVKPDYRPLVTAHSNYLESHKMRKIVIQGNTDERGGSEYNLALGQKRAEAVRKSLLTLGVSDGQMEAVSFGKEKPKAEGHDEAAWAQNRRADIVYTMAMK